MTSLKGERERRRLSLDEASRLVRIPVRYLQALEDGDESVLPAGPFLVGYRRQYLEFLGLDEQDLMATERAPAPEIPLGRLAAGGFVATVAAVIVLRLGAFAFGWLDRPEDVAPPPEAPSATQIVALRATDATKVKIKVDQGPVETVMLAAGDNKELRGESRVELDAQDLTRLVVTYNGERIEPLGNLARGRRLVFLRE